MVGGDHLGEVDDDQAPGVFVEEDIELVEVTVYKAVLREAHGKLHHLAVDRGRVR